MKGDAVKSDESEGLNPEQEMEVLADTSVEGVNLHDGRFVEVYKCKLRHAATVAGAINTIFIGLGVDSVGKLDRMDEVLDNPQILLSTLDMSTDVVISVAEALTSLSREEVEELDMDDAIAVLVKVFEVNRDFFLKRVQPVLSGLLASPEAEAS